MGVVASIVDLEFSKQRVSAWPSKPYSLDHLPNIRCIIYPASWEDRN